MLDQAKPRKFSAAKIFRVTVTRTAVDISRQVLPILTIPVDVAVRRVILHVTAPSRTHTVVAVTTMATASVAHQATIRTIRPDNSAQPVGVVVRMVTTLTSVTIRPCISRMDRHQGTTIRMDQWKTGVGFARKENVHLSIDCPNKPSPRHQMHLPPSAPLLQQGQQQGNLGCLQNPDQVPGMAPGLIHEQCDIEGVNIRAIADCRAAASVVTREFAYAVYKTSEAIWRE